MGWNVFQPWQGLGALHWKCGHCPASKVCRYQQIYQVQQKKTYLGLRLFSCDYLLFFLLREGCVEALYAMVENVSVHKAIVSVVEGGINHKSVVVRTHVAMLMDHVISAIKAERFYGASKETQVSWNYLEKEMAPNDSISFLPWVDQFEFCPCLPLFWEHSRGFSGALS